LCTHVCPINTFCFAHSLAPTSLHLGCAQSLRPTLLKGKKIHFYSSTPTTRAGAIPGNSRSLSFFIEAFLLLLFSSLKNLIQSKRGPRPLTHPNKFFSPKQVFLQFITQSTASFFRLFLEIHFRASCCATRAKDHEMDFFLGFFRYLE